MDRDRLEIIRAARGGSRSSRSSQDVIGDVRARANTRDKFRAKPGRATSAALDVEALRELAAKYRAR